MTIRVAIVTDDPGWHGARLRRAFKARGVDAQYVSLTQCRLDIGCGKLPVRMPGFDAALPDAVFVRGVPGGSLEQVIVRLDVLHALRELGVPVYNDARAIERSVDKAMTSFLLRLRGLPTPPTWVTENIADARAIVLRETAAATMSYQSHCSAHRATGCSGSAAAATCRLRKRSMAFGICNATSVRLTSPRAGRTGAFW